MNRVDRAAFRIHTDLALFQEAIGFTAAQTGFSQRLIEKDYFCSLLLTRLASDNSSNLVFKGGTCLAKVHSKFYRMSEDLDFVIPVATDCSRSERRRRIAGFKKGFAAIADLEPHFTVKEPFKGANESRQYLGSVSYPSQVQAKDETVKIEVALREPLLTAPVEGSARTALLNPVSAEPLLLPFPVPCISLIEAFAEKFRAALTRREVAIRDFYDIDFGVRELGILPDDTELVHLVGQKVAVPGNDPIDVSPTRMTDLENQIESRLKPVLRRTDFDDFDKDRAVGLVLQMADLLRTTPDS